MGSRHQGAGGIEGGPAHHRRRLDEGRHSLRHGRRARPTWGDPSWRRLRADATSASTTANHLHIDTGYIERDLNVALPLGRLRELVAAGDVGSMADSHYSIMGFQGRDSSTLENQSAPEIAAAMKSEEVDLALLAPV